MGIRKALVVAGVVALPAGAWAQPIEGLYVGVGAGYNWLQNQKFESVTVSGAPQATNGTKLHTDGGPVGTVSIGYGLGFGLRVELQGDYRYSHQTVTGSPLNGGSVNNNTYGAFVNVLYDFDIGVPFAFPYVGIGGGYEFTNLNGGRTTSVLFPGTALQVSSSSRGSGAAQGMLGVAIPIPDMPGLSATVEYRFMAEFSEETFGGSVVGLPTQEKLGKQYNHAGLIGLRYAFNVPPPPPPPAPAAVPAPVPATARTYLVFFDWDKYDLTERARQIIGEAAANVAKVQVTRIEVNGYTDTSGTPPYNQRLSVRRADAVKAELVRDGVPADEIVTRGFGQTHLLVPTGPGVREPQNRRVEIILK
jgi:outer membrane protein OmpA-like peptidoglycan-associated protein